LNRLIIHFSGGLNVLVQAESEPLKVAVNHSKAPATKGADRGPTKRQLEYLAFIAKYLGRFGRAPAEADIERHFLVSAPSVNQMMQTLERRGFIARQRGVPRSIRVCVDLPQHER
jgi:repressor LexA